MYEIASTGPGQLTGRTARAATATASFSKYRPARHQPHGHYKCRYMPVEIRAASSRIRLSADQGSSRERG